MSGSPSLKDVVGKDGENASNSSASNSEGGGNNSDNSALVSLGNASFGFNFESDGGFHTGSGSGSNSPDEGDSDQGDRKVKDNGSKDAAKAAASPTPAAAGPSSESAKPQSNQQQSQDPTQLPSANARPPMSAGAAAARLIKTESMKPAPQDGGASSSSTQQDAAATAVANLNQIATDAVKQVDEQNEDAAKRGLKRKPDDSEGDEVKTEETAENASTVAFPTPVTSSTAGATAGNKKKKLDDTKREERNAREKERSFRISKQINELRTLLSSGGVIVPKGTKSSVLTEAANYIRMLQQHQYRSEIDRHQLVQQVQHIGGGALGPQAAQAVRHVAAQNGVWSLGNFGGVPPKSAMSTIYHPSTAAAPEEPQSSNSGISNSVEDIDYRHVFNSCTVGMAIASMGGAFIDCNKFFCQISNYTKQQICSMTVFNLTARQDLQAAFDLISQMLSAPLDPTVTNTSCVLRGALRQRPDVGLSVKLIKGIDGVAKCFCITLIQNPSSAFDSSRPVPATITLTEQGQLVSDAKNLNQAPAYTSG